MTEKKDNGKDYENVDLNNVLGNIKLKKMKVPIVIFFAFIFVILFVMSLSGNKKVESDYGVTYNGGGSGNTSDKLDVIKVNSTDLNTNRYDRGDNYTYSAEIDTFLDASCYKLAKRLFKNKNETLNLLKLNMTTKDLEKRTGKSIVELCESSYVKIANEIYNKSNLSSFSINNNFIDVDGELISLSSILRITPVKEREIFEIKHLNKRYSFYSFSIISGDNVKKTLKFLSENKAKSVKTQIFNSNFKKD